MRQNFWTATGSLLFTLAAALLPAQTNLALGKPITASSSEGPFVATNANDGSPGTYWEGAGSYPQTLTVSLGANAHLGAIVVALDAGWGARVQTIEILGRPLGTAAFTSLVPPTAYTFDPAIGNTVTIPVTASVSDIQLSFTANSGSSGGQMAEVQLLGPGARTADTNLALGRPIVASSTIGGFVALNANDGVVTSYWEGGIGTYPNTLSVSLGGAARIASVVVKLNPGWGGRTQTIEVLGRRWGNAPFESLVPETVYTLEPATGNSITIPVAATVDAVRLAFTANSGATAGQVAELQVLGRRRRSHHAPEIPTGTNETMVHLFEWSWADVATECETFLGPKGYNAVQVSPPNEHITDARWWARYQPVSYVLESRGGTREQFVDMVRRCRASGVDIYADVVLNHTASLGGGGIGWAGTPWTLRSHPMYGFDDYHNASCPNGIDYQNAWSVQTCDLVGLPDLDTGSASVQRTLTGYLNDLLDVGVKGFRIDAAKHVSPDDLSDILRCADHRSTIYPEVIDLGGPEAVHSADYVRLGPVEEFKYSRYVGAHFKGGELRALQTFGASWGMLPSSRSIVFTDNHDNQRGHGAGGQPLTYRDGALYDLGNVFMLAWPHGYPRVMSSYDFVDSDAGPPSVPVHDTGGVNCFGSAWKCEHRWRPIANMVGFRRTVASAPVSLWWDNGGSQIAFARTRRGFVVINREGAPLTRTFDTSLPPGNYCNVIEGDFSHGGCSGPTITVGRTGRATITVPALRAAAIHIGARL